MALNFGQYVYKPHQLQDWDFGKGLRDLAAARRDQQQINNQDRQARASLAETTASRGDLNTRFAATEGFNQADTEYAKEMEKYKRAEELAQRGNDAAYRNDWSGGLSAGTSLRQMGGTFTDEYDADGNPTAMTFAPPDMPTRRQPNIQALRSGIFGGGGGPQQQPQSPTPGGFDMRSNVGPGGSPMPGQNPFERLPGASAAALPPPQAAPTAPPMPAVPQAPPVDPGPPPGPAVDGVTPPVSAGGTPPAPAEQTPAEADLAALEAMGGPDDEVEEPPADGQPQLPVKNPALPSELERPDSEVLAEPEDPNKSADIREMEANGEKLYAEMRARGLMAPEGQELPAEAEAPPAAAEAPPAPQPSQPDRPNPFSTQTFSPYRIDLRKVQSMNQARTRPMLDAAQAGSPLGMQPRLGEYNRKMLSLGMTPEDTFKLHNPTFENITGMYRGEVARDAEALRAGRNADQQAWSREQREEDQFQKQKQTAFNNAGKLLASESLTKLKARFNTMDSLNDMIDNAGTNGVTANQVVGKVHQISQPGVMTDADFAHAREGVVSLWTAFKRGIMEKVVMDRGLDPDTLKDLREFAQIAMKSSRREMTAASSRIINIYRSIKNPAERQGYKEAAMGYFPEEYWPPEFRETPYGSADAPSREEPAGDSPKVSPNGTVFERGSGVPEKPARKGKKQLADMTDAEINALSDDEMADLIRQAEEGVARERAARKGAK